jgi:hypothetical protein
MASAEYFVDALVADFGCGTTKIGFSGHDVPAAILPSVVGASAPLPAGAGASAAVASSPAVVSWWRRRGARGTGERLIASPTDAPAPGVAFRPLLDASTGLVTDWDGALAQFEWALTQRLGVSVGRSGGGANGGDGSGGAGASVPPLGESAFTADASAHPVLLVESVYASKADREKWAQILFEEYDVPGVFMARAGVLALYANARVSGISIDFGAGGVTITPVQEGYPLMGGVRRSPVGGLALDEALLAAARARGNPVRPHLPSSSARAATLSMHSSVLHWSSLKIVRDARESLCRIFESTFVSEDHAHAPTVTYDLPDGSVLSIGAEQFSVPEMLFDPSSLLAREDSPYAGAQGLGEMFQSSVLACNPEPRRDLVSNCVVTGGLSATEGLLDRLHKELSLWSPQGTKVRPQKGRLPRAKVPTPLSHLVHELPNLPPHRSPRSRPRTRQSASLVHFWGALSLHLSAHLATCGFPRRSVSRGHVLCLALAHRARDRYD